MKYGFISYNTPHLKTDQVLSRWSARTDASTLETSRLFLIPFNPRPPRKVVFNHRPPHEKGAHPQELAQALGMKCALCQDTESIPIGLDAYIILGAGLLPDRFVESERVVNAHPGLIPFSRGLDSFKWALYYKRPVGVTLHQLSKETDMGDIWVKWQTPVTPSDTLESFALRHYELEIDLISHFEDYIHEKPMKVNREEAKEATKRMPANEQENLWSYFEDYKHKYLQR